MVFSCDVLLSVPRRRYRKHDVKIFCSQVCESCGLIRICPIWFWVWLLCLLGERIAEMLPSDVAKGHILKDTLQANHKSEEATRKHHKAKARSVIKKECGRRPHSKKDPAGKSQVGRIKHECGHICIHIYIYIYIYIYIHFGELHVIIS